MPGRRRRRGWGDGSGEGACSRRINRFIEPCLLLLLRSDASHGYNLVDELQRFGFTPGSMDASVVYRTLREMEQQGWVTSQWDTSGSGPPRRVYKTTPNGNDYLRRWVNDLRRTRDGIDQFIETYIRQGRELKRP